MAEVVTSNKEDVNVQYQELKDYDPDLVITRQDTRDRDTPRQGGYRYDDMMAKYRVFNFLKMQWFIVHLIFLVVLFEENHWYESYKDQHYNEYALCGIELSGTHGQLFTLVTATTLTFLMLILFFVYFRRGQYIFYESNDIGSVSLSKEAWDARKIKTKKRFFQICIYDFTIWVLNNILIFVIICIGISIQTSINDWDATCCKDLVEEEMIDDYIECSNENDYSGIIYIYITYIILETVLLVFLNKKLKKQAIINWVNRKLSCL